ncbi:MAG TPA: pur operon repressor, partial [Desulfosporosinus sp.]|nr:pur operon repressor [Desulfosporosinus sp.]
MEKMKRAERMVAITQVLMLKPNVLTPLSLFAERFGTAKSTISEDLMAVKGSLLLSGQGHIETISGASGGVRY